MQRFDARRIGAILLVGFVFCLLPLVLPTGLHNELTRLAVLAGSAMVLNLLVGSVGLISLGQGLFFGFGAYAVAVGTLKLGLTYGASVLIGLLIALPLSLVVALISLRARHLFFGLLTLAIGQVAYVLATRSYELTGGEDGLVGIPIPVWLDGTWPKHLLAVGMLVLVCLFLLRLLSSPFGIILTAVRDNADRVASLGGNPWYFEVAAMVITGLLGTVFGMVAATTEGNVDPGLFAWLTSAMTLMMVALGGRSVFLGPIIGAVVLELTRVLVQARSENSDLVVGLIVICCALAFPEGLGRAVPSMFGRRGRDVGK